MNDLISETGGGGVKSSSSLRVENSTSTSKILKLWKKFVYVIQLLTIKLSSLMLNAGTLSKN